MQKDKYDVANKQGDYRLTRAQITARISSYDFNEMSDILRFLSLICGMQLDDCDYIYIRSKLGQCLSAHDDSSSYFIPLRELACELDCLVRRRLKAIL